MIRRELESFPVLHPLGGITVCGTAVKRDLCVGCGICVAVCPSHVLRIEWNDRGEYRPYESGECPKTCHVCVDVCPFLDHSADEDTLARGIFSPGDDLRHTAETGYYLGVYAGHVTAGDFRSRGTSGGIVQWLLRTALEEGMADGVICVVQGDDPEKLFAYSVLRTPDDFSRLVKSAYYPVDLSESLAAVLARPGKYVVVALPCFLKGLKLATAQNKAIRERIALTVGLSCGQTKSKGFAEYLIRAAGFQVKDVTGLSFREKDPGKPANAFYCSVTTKNGSGRIPSEAYGKLYNTGQFQPNCCNYCDDVFAELADISVMDAWLPEYMADSRGSNIVLTRTPQADSLIRRGIERGLLALTPIPIESAIESNDSPSAFKRSHLPYRLWLARRRGDPPPRKRMPFAKPGWLMRSWLQAREAVRSASFEALVDQQRASPEGLSDYHARMAHLLRRYYRRRWLVRHIDAYLQTIKRRIRQ